MEPQSPPKRVTRSRAARSTDSAPTKVVTTAARAKTTRVTATTSVATTRTTAAKRKLRSEDMENEEAGNDDDELGAVYPAPARATRATRGRPQKTAEPEPSKKTKTEPTSAPKPEPVAVPRRGRPPKKIASATPCAKEETASVAAKPVRAARTKNTQPTQEEPEEVSIKPATRTRAVSVTSKAPVKKTVQFEEPEKENILPAAATKTRTTKAASSTKTAAPEPPATGLRARPVRKAALPAAARPTRGVAKTSAQAKKEKAEEEQEGEPGKTSQESGPTPLSPKKITQLAQPKDLDREAESDDELAGDRTPHRPLMKNPVRPPASLRLEMKEADVALEIIEVDSKLLPVPEPSVSAGILNSPARRPQAMPHKDVMKSPARRGAGVPVINLPKDESGGQDNQLPMRASLLSSPAKRLKSPIKGMNPSNLNSSTLSDCNRSPLKSSLLASPAKRPLSPIKGIRPPQPRFEQTSQAEHVQEDHDRETEMDSTTTVYQARELPPSPTRASRQHFPGRLSTVLPRHADPDLKKNPMLGAPRTCSHEDDVLPSTADEFVEAGEPMDVDVVEPSMELHATETIGMAENSIANGAFGLRQKDLDPFVGAESDSDDDLDCHDVATSSTQDSAVRTPRRARNTLRSHRERQSMDGLQSTTESAQPTLMAGQYGFTPLAEKLSDWKANSPLKVGLEPQQSPLGNGLLEEKILTTVAEALIQDSPAKPGFFDDAISVAPESIPDVDKHVNKASSYQAAEAEVDIDEPELEPVRCTQEDFELAAEADVMSLLEPSQHDEALHNDLIEDNASEASQEYGDENDAPPIDPALTNSPGVPPVTPKRFVTRTFHTVSKIPLKPADDSTPKSVGSATQRKQRRHSLAKVPAAISPSNRPTKGLQRNATVISYSPTKKETNSIAHENAPRELSAYPETPVKSTAGWSTSGTPARTPRQTVNPALLRGAVVFVDVRTSDGAEASSIFVDLLTQMGARCVKSWAWDPESQGDNQTTDEEDEDMPSGSKIGITHVVYKDGGRRTLEKVRETNGVVQCVGVSWVLDCERENEWLDEAPYYIETTLGSHSGVGRRKTMEPRAFAETASSSLDDSSGRRKSRDCKTAPSTPANGRRSSGLWMRTPEDEVSAAARRASSIYGDGDGDFGDEDADWELESMLMPVPKTPAPETIARYAANVTPDTPSVNDETLSLSRDELMMRTCPPKPAGDIMLLGEGLLAREKDEGVLQRLMAARRKSLQFAPKVGSPLAKTWP
ncbi:uncharacterized protein PpBr36_10854 [Pyricularia pennisetigena]|uniref:uncharacterized protein n=1 Tax=Pyricularia pennisetigena TaxID=1578925 RepID=UPI001153457F|nr:uncharacterized protein PpBr36_10854 [Pyricularia pennisetigena]TLS21003.1 hypothetical protein PpBr36_10854 [Pyricularia pennisetigena]